jgi:hypothetical protein
MCRLTCHTQSDVHTVILAHALHASAVSAQLQQLNGVKVAVVEKVDAANLVGGATDGLVAIRNQFFPYGELEDGGGAVPPTAAGGCHLVNST